MNKFITEYGLFAFIGIVFLVVFPPLLAAPLGPLLGTYAGYGATLVVLLVVYWLNKKAQKKLVNGS